MCSTLTEPLLVCVEVATPAILELRRSEVEDDKRVLDIVVGERRVIDMMEEEKIALDIMEGETIQLECEGRGGYPAPEILWNFPGQEGVRGNQVR